MPPRGMNLRSCITRSILACVSGPMVPISSRKIVPRSATSNCPFLDAMALVNAPLTWPKSVDSSRSAAASRCSPARTAGRARGEFGVNRLGDQFLAGAALAWIRMVERLGATWPTRSKILQHGLALADDVGEAVALLERALEVHVFFFRAAARHCGRRRSAASRCPRASGVVRGAGLHGAARQLPRSRKR